MKKREESNGEMPIYILFIRCFVRVFSAKRERMVHLHMGGRKTCGELEAKAKMLEHCVPFVFTRTFSIQKMRERKADVIFTIQECETTHTPPDSERTQTQRLSDTQTHGRYEMK